MNWVLKYIPVDFIASFLLGILQNEVVKDPRKRESMKEMWRRIFRGIITTYPEFLSE